MRRMKTLNASWVLHTDTDEFVTYNYLEDDEDHNNFDAYRKRETEAMQQAHEREFENCENKSCRFVKSFPVWAMSPLSTLYLIFKFQVPVFIYLDCKLVPKSHVWQNYPKMFLLRLMRAS